MTSWWETEPQLAAAAREMVERQLRARGIRDERVLEAMARVPRHLFVEPRLRGQAYGDHPLPIGHDQTISQPYMVALMTQLCAVRPTDRALEVGCGSGYQSAVLSLLCAEVYATEIVEELAQLGRRALERVGAQNVLVEHRDGSAGWSEHGPYDVILVAAGAPAIPDPLQQQLADGGRLVIPVGPSGLQTLQLVTRQGERFQQRSDTACRFVRLVGARGWPSAGDGPSRRP